MYPDILGPSCCYASMVEVHFAITIDDDQRAGVSHSPSIKKGITVPLVSCRFHLWFASPMCWGQKHWRRLSDQQPCLPSLLFLCFASLPLWSGGASGDGTWVAHCHCELLGFLDVHWFIGSLNLGIPGLSQDGWSRAASDLDGRCYLQVASWFGVQWRPGRLWLERLSPCI